MGSTCALIQQIYHMKKILCLIFVVAVVFQSCKSDEELQPSDDQNIEALVADTGGSHIAHRLNSDASPYGYYLYTPGGYKPTGPKYPLLIFLHGSGEKGNSATNPAELDKILVNGPPKLIKAKQWTPKTPMLVASLQCHDGWWDAGKIKAATEFLMKTYAVDTTRIYMTGLSMGGYATWDQVGYFGKSSHVTAAIPVSGAGTYNATRVSKASKIPIWAFHGNSDGTVSPDYDKQMYKSINALNPKVKMKLTLYPNVGHDGWSRTYNNSAIGQTVVPGYNSFDMNIYDWLLQYKKQ